VETLFKVLLLGDSIRMSYQRYVARLLEGKETVVGPADNCQYALYTLSSLDRCEDHLSEAGQKACSQAVAESLAPFLSMERSK
jgi:hypothetical protein